MLYYLVKIYTYVLLTLPYMKRDLMHVNTKKTMLDLDTITQ